MPLTGKALADGTITPRPVAGPEGPGRGLGGIRRENPRRPRPASTTTLRAPSRGATPRLLGNRLQETQRSFGGAETTAGVAVRQSRTDAHHRRTNPVDRDATPIAVNVTPETPPARCRHHVISYELRDRHLSTDGERSATFRTSPAHAPTSRNRTHTKGHRTSQSKRLLPSKAEREMSTSRDLSPTKRSVDRWRSPNRRGRRC